jgi:hypothetical protein
MAVQLMDIEEREADRLLEAAGIINLANTGGRRKRQDCYTDKQLINHHRRELTNYEDGIHLYEVNRQEYAALFQRDLVDLGRLAHFSTQDMDVWQRFCEGFAPDYIAELYNLRESAVVATIERLEQRVRVTMIVCWWWGWYEVYLEELHRD